MVDEKPFRPRAYSPEDVAAIWACSPYHIRKLCRTRALPSFRLGGKLIRIKPEDVEAFERQNASPPASQIEASLSAAADLREVMKRARRAARREPKA